MSPPKPLRSYVAFLTAEGDRFEMQVNVDQETLRRLMAAGAIDEAEVESLANEHRIPAKPAEICALTWAANIMRVTKPSDDVIEDVEAAARVKECEAVAGRLAKKIAALQGDSGKLVGADMAGEDFIRFRGDRGSGVILIDTALLARFRAEADRMQQYLRDWPARALPRNVRKKTLHGDIMHLVRIIERVSLRPGKKIRLGFGNPTGRGVMFIEAILIRAAVITEKASNGEKIVKAIRRYRDKVKELKKRPNKLNHLRDGQRERPRRP